MSTQVELSNSDLKQLVPSVFAKKPWDGVSARYAFIPTIDAIDALRDTGFVPVRAKQSKVRIKGKASYTKHMLRFRHKDDVAKAAKVGGEVAEVILSNAHDRSSAYRLDAGIFRFICDNGMVIASANFGSIHIRHSGDVVDEVLRGTADIIRRTPLIREQVAAWRAVGLTEKQRLTLAEAVLIHRYGLDDKDNLLSPVRPETLLEHRRPEDAEHNLWITTNVIQENLMRGQLEGLSRSGRRIRTRPIVSVNTELEINRGVWSIADALAAQLATH